jgi:hypothetical protein
MANNIDEIEDVLYDDMDFNTPQGNGDTAMSDIVEIPSNEKV